MSTLLSKDPLIPSSPTHAQGKGRARAFLEQKVAGMDLAGDGDNVKKEALVKAFLAMMG